MSSNDVAGVLGKGLPRALQQAVGEVDLLDLGALGDALKRVPVPVACHEVHRGVDVDRVQPQDPLDDGDGFDEVGPVQCVEEAKRADSVRDRDLVRRLALLVADGLAVEAKTPCRELTREPCVDGLGTEFCRLEPL